jgi:5'-nucleotidase
MQNNQHAPQVGRGIYCNRTLNLRSVKAIGYDMDYTLIHYKVEAWERRAYEFLRDKLVARGWPVAKLEFDPDMTVRGLVLDTELGNVVKTNRFGYVKRAFHGTQPIAWEQQRDIYSRVVIDLASERFVFVNTLFSKSEVCMYSQLVDLIDRRALPDVLGYADLYREVKRSLDEAHMEGALKAEIVADPDRFVELDEETPLALLDQERAGKKLLLITNSEWSYTKEIMVYAFDRFLPDGMSWRDLFDVIIVSARKPEFFTGRSPAFRGGRRAGPFAAGGRRAQRWRHLPGRQRTARRRASRPFG